MTSCDDFAARNRFGRVARIATPTPLGVGDIDLVMSEVIGHLDVLADQGRIVIEERDGCEIARAA